MRRSGHKVEGGAQDRIGHGKCKNTGSFGSDRRCEKKQGMKKETG